MTEEERTAEASDRIHTALQECLNEGLLEEGMVQDWVLVGSSISLEDGEEGTILLHPAEQRLRGALGLLEVGRIMVDEGVREWFRDE